MNIFPNTPNYDILGQRKFWLLLSLVLSVLTFVVPFFKAPNWGVDFAGGSELQVQFKGPVDAGGIRDVLGEAGLKDPSVQQFGDPKDNEFLIRGQATLYSNEAFASQVEPKLRAQLTGLADGAAGIAYNETEGEQVTIRAKTDGSLSGETVRAAFNAAGIAIQDVRAINEGSVYSVLMRGVSDKVEQALTAKFGSLKPDNGTFLRRVEQVGASVGNELKVAAIKALLLSILLIMIYIGFRFDFAFATGAVVSLAHDAVIVIGFYLVTGAELNTSTIAAVLTIVGYSVNDTVIIFDRIRENMGKHKGRDLYRLINDSVNETLSRTIITHFTVMLSLSGLIIFTVGSLREFSLAMFVGVITGTYSSVFIASPIVIWIEDILKARREAEELTAKAARKDGSPVKA